MENQRNSDGLGPGTERKKVTERLGERSWVEDRGGSNGCSHKYLVDPYLCIPIVKLAGSKDA